MTLIPNRDAFFIFVQEREANGITNAEAFREYNNLHRLGLSKSQYYGVYRQEKIERLGTANTGGGRAIKFLECEYEKQCQEIKSWVDSYVEKNHCKKKEAFKEYADHSNFSQSTVCSYYYDKTNMPQSAEQIPVNKTEQPIVDKPVERKYTIEEMGWMIQDYPRLKEQIAKLNDDLTTEVLNHELTKSELKEAKENWGIAESAYWDLKNDWDKIVELKNEITSPKKLVCDKNSLISRA